MDVPDAFTLAPVGLAEFAGGRVVRVNEPFAAIVGETAPALGGRTLEGVFPAAPADAVASLTAGRDGPILLFVGPEPRSVRAESRASGDRLVVALVPFETSGGHDSDSEMREVTHPSPLVVIESARLNAELARAQQQLVRRERLAALGELAAQVAHEVRNPLGVIFSSLGSLARLVPLEGDARRLFDMLREEAGRLNRIVAEMLDYTRPVEPKLRPVVLERVLRDAADSALVSERARGTPVDAVSFDLSVAPDLPILLLDDGLVHQGVVNLVSNALHSLGGRGRLSIRAELHAEGARCFVRVDVSDDGPGIPPEAVARVFEPFFTTKATGSGLGLAIVRRIAEAHRGDVSVQAGPRRGTTFHFDLPADAALGARP